MQTERIEIDRERISLPVMERAGEILRGGGLVAFPTETVYGLGADALNEEAAQKIYAAKGRPSDNPLIVHIADPEALERIVETVPEEAKALADAFWPGPLTMIFHKKDCVPYGTTGGLSTVAVRMPSDEIARELIRRGGGYVAAPSANLSGRPSPTTAQHVYEDMNGRIPMILDGGPVRIGLESTIVDMTETPPDILRPGYITLSMIRKIVGKAEVDRGLTAADSKIRPKAPGMKYRHYAPRAELLIVEGPVERVVSYINEKCSASGDVGVICTEETRERYPSGDVKCIGSRRDERSIASHLFAILREFDEDNVRRIYSESFDTPGLGQAIMNRLLKAAGHRRIDVSGRENRREHDMTKTVVMDHPLIRHKIGIIRRKETGSRDFRHMISEIAMLMCYEATRELKLVDVEIETPICRTTAKELEGKKLAVVPILRAGLGMVEGMLTMIPAAKVGHIGLYRNEETLEPVEYYCKLPKDCSERDVFVVDPMLATGGSASAAIAMLKARGVKQIRFMCIIAAPEGIERMHRDHPDVELYIGAVDEKLNESGYIVPGLGDAGDRIFGTK